jgi:3-oxoacyl-[acyl-carrier protein] reductase
MTKKEQNNFVLITGSARGLGKELALVFASNNFDIILHDKTVNDLKEIEEKISKRGVNYCSVVGDLKSDKTLGDLYQASREKGLAVLINNAGILCLKLPFQDFNNEQIGDVMLTNLVSPIKLTSRIYPLFLENGQGTIININSICGLEAHKFRALYSSSKYGLRGFSDTLKLEAEENGIRVIDIYPSQIRTRPEFTTGLETRYVAKKVYHVYKNTNLNKIILDDRLEKFAGP